jgi:alpha-galactosidase
MSMTGCLLAILVAVGLYILTSKRMTPGDAYARLTRTPPITTKLHVSQHTLLTAVEFKDVTDQFNELVQEREWLLHPAEPLTLRGNLFVLENVLDHSGQIALKLGPLPTMRAIKSDWDLQVYADKQGGYHVQLREDETYPWQIIDYTGGQFGQTRALHQAQRQRMASHEINFLSNTWGDRNQDAQMNETFIIKEIQAGARLGVEVIQLDDGWQKGRTVNSIDAQKANGKWEGFHDSAADFWTPDLTRFPNGLEPILQAAHQAGVAIGLWYAPDSANDFANWQTDVQTVICLYKQYGIRHFKFDSINTRSRLGEINLAHFFDALAQQSDRQIIVDMDITANCRPGYFGRIDCGPLFVTNRYSDWHNYWPHQTLRNLWQLSRWVDPMRLRMMFLNNTRNTELYANDPLAPQQVSPESLFAPLMFCQPLGWFENSNLPSEYFQQVKPMVDLWKIHRQAIHAGTVFPVGHVPDGVNWSGFVSINTEQTAGYLLVCNGQQVAVNLTCDLPGWISLRGAKQLAGTGQIQVTLEHAKITDMTDQSFWFGTIEMTPAIETALEPGH